MRKVVILLTATALLAFAAGTAQAQCDPNCVEPPALPVHGATGPADAGVGAAPLAGVLAALGALGAGLALVDMNRELRDDEGGR